MISLEDVAINSGPFSLAGACLQVAAGDYAILMGKTGSGKTTLLEAICGLRKVVAGRILLMNRDVTRLKPAERGVGYVPQDRALFASLTVREHLCFSLRIRHWSEADMAARVQELADWLGLGRLLDRTPHGLSGGEAQRVALGRALAFRPAVLLLDEPLTALDSETKSEMVALLRTVRSHTGATVLHVTHDVQEAKTLADCIFHLRDGVIIPGEADSPMA
ncbi:MAG: ATP-binding cassette domain-containing protein [Planctomycetes bacterium]|nr:ATP-binding cassette domain-containing protein [Planctomycetota bacterium]